MLAFGLGELLMGFATFWVYLWFCQYMLIWFANLPEEVTWYKWCHRDAWAVLSAAGSTCTSPYQPVFQPQRPVLGIWEIAPLVGAAALFLIFLRRGLAAADLVPRGDPYLAESLAHHQ